MSQSARETALSLELELEPQQTRGRSKGVEFLKLWELVKEFRVPCLHAAGRASSRHPGAACRSPVPRTEGYGDKGLWGRAGLQPGGVPFLQRLWVGSALQGRWEFGCFLWVTFTFPETEILFCH